MIKNKRGQTAKDFAIEQGEHVNDMIPTSLLLINSSIHKAQKFCPGVHERYFQSYI